MSIVRKIELPVQRLVCCIISTVMFYISGISVRTATDFLIKIGWKKGPGMLRKDND